MRRAAAVLALALLAGCTDGGGSPGPGTPSGTAAPIPTPVVTKDALVYATVNEVFVIPPGGSPQRIAGTTGEITDLEVSADGRYAAFAIGGDRLTVTVHDLATARNRTWASPTPDLVTQSIGRWGSGFVAVSEGTDNSLLAFDPERTLAGEAPAQTGLKGVTSARYIASTRDRLLVATGDEAGQRGGPETVYDVAPDGTTTKLFTDGDALPEGDARTLSIGVAGLSADGNTLVYGTGAAAGECELSLTVAVRDLEANREVTTKPPRLGNDVLTVVASVTAAGDGKTVVGFTTEVGGCPQPERAGAYALEGTTWKQAANGAIWAARGPGGRIATLTNADVLTVGGRVVGGGIFRAVWSPV